MAVELNATVSVSNVKKISAEMDIKIEKLSTAGTQKVDEKEFNVIVPGTEERIRLRYQCFYSPVQGTVRLHLYNLNSAELPITATISIMKNGIKLIEQEQDKDESNSHILEKRAKDISGSIGTLNIRSIIPEALRNDYLVVRLEMIILTCCRSALTKPTSKLYKTEFDESEKTVKNRIINEATKSLVEDVTKMMRDTSTDMTITCGPETFDVHRAFLMARSRVFEAALANPYTKESIERNITVKDFEPETITHFLSYMYESKFPDMDLEQISNLLMCADKYQVPSLVKACKDHLLNDLSEDKLVRVAILAHQLNDNIMKKIALTKMCHVEGNISEIKGYQDLQNFPNILSDLIQQKWS